MKKKKENKESEEFKEKELQLSWIFVLLGVLFAFSIGLTVNAIYELITEEWQEWHVAVIFGSISVFLLHFFTYFFENIQNINKQDEKTILKEYRKYLWNDLKKLFWFIILKVLPRCVLGVVALFILVLLYVFLKDFI